MVEKADIRSLSLAEIEKFFREKNEKPFRARQVYEWIWKKTCRSFDEMTNLSRENRQLLTAHFCFPVLQKEKELRDPDGTVKFTFRLPDNELIESVLIPADSRTTACISSQAGCALACRFCATGMLGFRKNLTFTEIFDQVVLLNRQSEKYHGKPLSNIVYMGMGEPLMNYEEVLKSIEKITSEESLGMSPQRITVSSVGIPAMIRKMADDKGRFHFALSLHAATNAKRDRIIPINKKHNLQELTEALKYYHAKTGKRVTIEYILFKDFNDSLEDAKDLAVFCKSFPVKINLIGYNPVEKSGFSQSTPEKTRAFREFLENKNMVINVRKSRGTNIDAACGQLALSDNINHQREKVIFQKK
ncbi:MAG: 23S rRNA (adenine(2503)-C(2))-methyltransferase RlmN [Bacteroidetes bacterium]|nr:MAG: 23S rRNA (adenine(2503)-C(2))-methyltransferase RlmN [Bacteroidota bacterium]